MKCTYELKRAIWRDNECFVGIENLKNVLFRMKEKESNVCVQDFIKRLIDSLETIEPIK